MSISKDWKLIRPVDVLKMKKPAGQFFCPMNANVVGLEFAEFTIKDYYTKEVIFKTELRPPEDIDYNDLDSLRRIKYTFKKSFLEAKAIGTKVVFRVGDNEVKKLRMIEMHYFQDKLLKVFDFSFDFCIPNSTNTWENVYEVPKLNKKTKREMLNNPYMTVSDSFYFVGEEEPVLIMHNKAFYQYE